MEKNVDKNRVIQVEINNIKAMLRENIVPTPSPDIEYCTRVVNKINQRVQLLKIFRTLDIGDKFEIKAYPFWNVGKKTIVALTGFRLTDYDEIGVSYCLTQHDDQAGWDRFDVFWGIVLRRDGHGLTLS